MNKRELLFNVFKTFIYGILAGICISLGGTAFLACESKIVGALFFCIGLFTILFFGFNLFTGKVCYVFENDKKFSLNLIFIWLGNFVGTLISGLLLSLTRLSNLQEKCINIVNTKLNDSLLSIFILAILCNICIFIAVDGWKNAKDGIVKVVSLVFGVSVFIICGFEHCVANMFYISFANMWSLKSFGYLLITTLGNAVGGILIPLIIKLFNKKTE